MTATFPWAEAVESVQDQNPKPAKKPDRYNQFMQDKKTTFILQDYYIENNWTRRPDLVLLLAQ
jgi:hypothetical protein